MTRESEYNANRELSETPPPAPQRRSTDRKGWVEAILIGLIVAAFIAGASFAGQWIDSLNWWAK